MAHGHTNAEILEDMCPTLCCNHEQPIAFNHQTGGDFRPQVNVDQANALQKCQGQAVAIGADCYNGQITGDVACTMGTPGSSVNASGPTVMTGMQVRRLLPVETERLQGFPDNHTRIPWRGKPAKDCPDGGRYKSIGNSMAVPVMRWVGERIQRHARPQ